MKRIAARKVTKKKLAEEVVQDVTIGEEEVKEAEEDLDYTLDMEHWEEEFDYSDMRGLFYIQKGQYANKSPNVTVKLGKDYMDRKVGGYNPADPKTSNQYVVFDRVIFHSIYSGSSLEAAIKAVEKNIIKFRNNPERYFREICTYTNEDFYARHYEGRLPFSDAELKRRAEEGRCWRASMPMKKMGYAIWKTYNYFYADELSAAEERAEERLKGLKEERKSKLHRNKKVKRLGV